MLLTKVLFIFSVVSTCSCWYYYNYYYNPYDKYFRKPFSYFTRQNSNCEKWCYSYTTPNIHCCVYKERPNTCPYPTVYCTVPLAPDFTAQFQCIGDLDCPVGYKCCDDSCFSHKICKSHNIEWLRWNTYAYNYHPPSTAPSTSYSPKESEDQTEATDTTITSPTPSTFVTEATSDDVTEIDEIFTTIYTSTTDSPKSENEINTEDTDETSTTPDSSQSEIVVTTESVFYTNTDEFVTTYDASQLENVTFDTSTDEFLTTYDASHPENVTFDIGTEETSSTFTTPSTSTTRNDFGALFSLFGKKETETTESDRTEEFTDNSVDLKETEANGANETDTSKRPDEEIGEVETVFEGSGTELEEKESEPMNKEGSGNDGDKKNGKTFSDDEDDERRKRSSIGQRKQNEKRTIIINVDRDDYPQNNDLFFDYM